MYEKANINGVGYKNVEMIISTQHGFSGAKLVEKESGSGNVIAERTELEAERQLNRDGTPIGAKLDPRHYKFLEDRPASWTVSGPGGEMVFYPGDSIYPEVLADRIGCSLPEVIKALDDMVSDPEQYTIYIPESYDPTCMWPTGTACPMDYINFTKEAEFEYMPVSYQTGTYDQKWIEKLCVQNYRIGAVLTEMFTHAEHLQKKTEVKTRAYGLALCSPCCTGVLEANLNAQVIGVAHIGWMSRDPEPSALVKGRHIEYGRSVEDLTGVFSIEKFIQLWGNSTCGAISVDWLPCL